MHFSLRCLRSGSMRVPTFFSETTRTLLPPPSAMFAAAWELTTSGDLLRNLHDSLMREAVAFLWAAIAIPIGIVMSWWPLVEEQLDPVLEILRPVPPLAWIPLSILLVRHRRHAERVHHLSRYLLSDLLNTITGVKGIEPTLIRAARCLGAPEWKILWRVVLGRRCPRS